MDAADFFRKRFKELFSAYQERGGTQTSLAKAAGVAQGQVSVWLRGGYLPGIESLDGIAKAFGVPVTTFFEQPGAESADADRRLILEALDIANKGDVESLLTLAQEIVKAHRNRTPGRKGSAG